MNILVVDDEANIVSGIEKRIQRFDKRINIYKAYNGFDAIKILSDENIDVCFIDINMPNMTGLQLISTIDKNIDFVIISGYASFEYAKEAINLKVYSYIVKPIDKDEFNNILSKLYEKHSLKSYSDNLRKIIGIIEDDFSNNNFSLSTLSSKISLSESYICRIVKKEMNLTFIDLLNKIRIEEAKNIMKKEKVSINFKTLYSKVGFSSQQYFNVIFKKYENKTPKEYINNL